MNARDPRGGRTRRGRPGCVRTGVRSFRSTTVCVLAQTATPSEQESQRMVEWLLRGVLWYDDFCQRQSRAIVSRLCNSLGFSSASCYSRKGRAAEIAVV